MEKTKRRERLGTEGWRAALKRCDESGLSVREFCAREGLGSVSFYRWRARLSAEPRQKISASKAPRPAPVPTGFLDLGTLGAKSTRVELRLELGAGVQLHLIRG